MTKISVLKSKAVLTFKYTFPQAYYSWLHHCAILAFLLLGSRATAVDPVYSKLFQDLLKCGHKISICAYTFDTQFICYNFSFEELFDSVRNSLVCKLVVQSKLSLLSCSVGIAPNSLLHSSALNCAITEIEIFRKQEINYFSMTSGTLIEFCVKRYILWYRQKNRQNWQLFSQVSSSLDSSLFVH